VQAALELAVRLVDALQATDPRLHGRPRGLTCLPCRPSWGRQQLAK